MMCYIAVPLFLPVFVAQNVDLVWLAMLVCVNLQTSFLTPPFGWALFFLRGVAPPQVTTRHMYVGVVPFISAARARRALRSKASSWAAVRKNFDPRSACGPDSPRSNANYSSQR